MWSGWAVLVCWCVMLWRVDKNKWLVMCVITMLYVYTACPVLVTVCSTSDKFWPISNFMVTRLTLAACSYVLGFTYIAGGHGTWEVVECCVGVCEGWVLHCVLHCHLPWGQFHSGAPWSQALYGSCPLSLQWVGYRCMYNFVVCGVGKMAQDVGMVWKCCGVVAILVGQFLRVPSLQALVFNQKHLFLLFFCNFCAMCWNFFTCTSFAELLIIYLW